MKADSTSSLEMQIILTTNEIKQLNRSNLLGSLPIRNRESKPSRILQLELQVASLNGKCYLTLGSLPKNTEFNYVAKYIITLSLSAYYDLVHDGHALQRLEWGASVGVFSEDYYNNHY